MDLPGVGLVRGPWDRVTGVDDQTHRYGDDCQETMPMRMFTVIARR